MQMWRSGGLASWRNDRPCGLNTTNVVFAVSNTNVAQLFSVVFNPFSFLPFLEVTPGDSLVRRSISQQKSGVSVTIDDPIRSTRQPSPPRGKVSNIIHVTNLVSTRSNKTRGTGKSCRTFTTRNVFVLFCPSDLNSAFLLRIKPPRWSWMKYVVWTPALTSPAVSRK